MNIKRLSLSAIIALMIAGCYPGGLTTYEETDIVLTTHNAEYPFTASKTYAMSEKIPMITTVPVSGQLPTFVDAGTTALILDQIDKNMASRGYTKATGNNKADLVILPAVVSVTTMVYYCNDWWNYWYWWGYYPGYPGYGGCYYPSGYTYTTGSLLITMLDDKYEDGNPATPVMGVWASGINGLLSGTTSSDNARITNAIDQAFVQSPYIKAN
jgi:hypothetical protein